MTTAVVILNWNTAGFLEKFIPGILESLGYAPDGSLPKGGRPSGELIVADSGSTDSSIKVLKEKFPCVKRIELGKNRGFTGGYNWVVQYLKGYKYFLLLNSDIEVTPGWLSPLERWMDENPDCAACAPKLHSYQRRDYFEYAGAAGGFLDSLGYPFCRGRILSHVQKDEGQYDSAPADVFWATGACLMIRTDLFERFGGLDKRFFAHMEEIDLCWRLQLRGYRISVVPESLVYHVGGGTLPQNSPGKLRLNHRNSLLTLENNLPYNFALDMLRKNPSRKDSAIAARALRRTRRRIFSRMLLDGLSALAYLLSFKKGYFPGVAEAHKEYRKLRSKATLKDVHTYLAYLRGLLAQGKSLPEVKGRYPGWMIPAALFHRGSLNKWAQKASGNQKNS